MVKEVTELTRYGNKKRIFTEPQRKRYRAYQKDYIRKTYKGYSFRLGLEADQDVIEVLDNCDNTTDYIRKLIRDDIKKKAEEEKE